VAVAALIGLGYPRAAKEWNTGMLATAQTGTDFSSLNEAAKQAVRRVFSGLENDSTVVTILATPAVDFRQLPENTLGVVEEGLLSVLASNTVVSVLDGGDLILPDAEIINPGCEPLRYGSDQGATLRLWPVEALSTLVRQDSTRHADWLAALVLTQSLTLRLAALHLREMVGSSTEPESFFPEQTIIQQGDPANHVYYLLEGEADVLVNDHSIARVRPGEMFGTMAALTQSHRNATVKAKTHCLVLQVPTEQFFELIRSHPAAIEKLLVDMAKSITQLNEEVVTLRHRLQSG
jgi:CRP/FNR family cyclic AMP-dependent transcriptional regulator